MHYNVLRRSVKSGNKSVYRWYYSFIDPSSGIKKQHVIPDCHNRADAYAYIQMLPDLDRKVVLIKDICKDMFIPGSTHIERLEQHGKSITIETCMRHRRTINVIVEQFGNLELKDLTVTAVDNFLRADTKHKGSWKNAFLETLNYVYKEAPFFGCTGIVKPPFPRFARNSKKADIFTTEELELLFDKTKWTNERDYLALLCMVSFGLRIGEVRAIQLRQFIFERNALVVDGFCKSNGARTDYNKKGNDEDKKWRVSFAPTSTISQIIEYVNAHNIGIDDFVFAHEDGRPLRREYLEDVFTRQLKKAGIEKGDRKLIPHSFRFTYVTRMRRELPAEVVQKLAGHSSVEMTDYYTRAAIPEMVAALESAMPAVDTLFE